MTSHDVKEHVKELVQKNPNSVLATIDENGFPCMRVMYTMCIEDDMTVYYVTGTQSRKCAQITANPKIAVQWIDPQTWQTVDYVGKAILTREQAVRERFWDDHLLDYFTGKDDPEYTIIEIKPEHVKFCCEMGSSVETVV